jgi:hypothetical protein
VGSAPTGAAATAAVAVAAAAFNAVAWVGRAAVIWVETAVVTAEATTVVAGRLETAVIKAVVAVVSVADEVVLADASTAPTVSDKLSSAVLAAVLDDRSVFRPPFAFTTAKRFASAVWAAAPPVAAATVAD